MTRRATTIKWVSYSLALLLVWVLDCLILSRYPVFGVRPVLIPIAVSVVATLEGAFSGAAFGILAGVLWVGTYTGIPSGMVLYLNLAGLMVGVVTQYAISQSFLGALICALGVMTVMQAIRVCTMLFIRWAPLEVLLQVAVPELLWSMVWMPLVYLLFRKVYKRVGGTRLAG